jgi:hypothetical protein
MKMIDMPSRLRDLKIAKSSVASCGVRTAVGSSRMRMSGSAVERLQDLHALLLSDRDVLDLRVRIDREAELALRALARGSRQRP